MNLEDNYLPLQEDNLPPISALAESPHTPSDFYPAPSIPRRSPSPTPISTIILDDIYESVFSKLNTMEVEVVNLAGSTCNLDSGDSEQELEESKQAFKKALSTQLLGFHGCGSTEQEKPEHQEIAPEDSVGLEVFIEPVVNETVPDVLGGNKLMERNSHNTTAESWESISLELLCVYLESLFVA